MSLLVDNHGRTVDYLRLAVTDRCNLRCFYCMPEEGIDYVDRKELMTYEEMAHIVALLADLGIRKLRITGGEPFLRKDLMLLLRKIHRDTAIESIHMTTNGTLTAPHLDELVELGIASVNLSLDSLDRERFHNITRRDDLPKVLSTMNQLVTSGIRTKINMVVMKGRNTQDIIPMARLAQEDPIAVRFIEQMPFNGREGYQFTWDHLEIESTLRKEFPDLKPVQRKHGQTAQVYEVPGFAGTLGIIAAYSRTFCGTCNRLRLTPTGMLRTCLYDQGVFNIKDLLRQGASADQLKEALLQAIGSRAKDGFEAEKARRGKPIEESMSTIGG